MATHLPDLSHALRPGDDGRRSTLRILKLVLTPALVLGLVAGCGGPTEPEPAGLPEGVTDFAKPVAPPKKSKIEPGSSADPANSAPASQ